MQQTIAGKKVYSPEELLLAGFDEALQKGETIVFATKCEIQYSGRAEAHLPPGDRVVIIKADRTILVHRPEGSNPINYMKANSQHKLKRADEGLMLMSDNAQTKEHLEIAIDKVFFVDSYRLEDGIKQTLAGSEKDMSDMLYDNPELVEPGFKPLNREEHTKYGFIDVFGYDNTGTLVVVECKRLVGDLSAVTQLRRYVEKIKESKGLEHVRGILACPTISANAEKMLLDWGFKHVSVQPPKFLERHHKKQKRLGEY